jgi:hypothetical protein
MLKTRRHLTDDRLVEIVAAATPAADEAAHLRACPACAGRRDRVAALLRDVSRAAADEADAAFPPERLARQRARILGRVGQLPQAAPVAAFPARPDVRPRSGTTRRWIGMAASAAAGLLLGVVAGQVWTPIADDLAPAAASIESAEILRPARIIPARPAAATAAISDDELLLQIETAGAGPRRATLHSLDVLTPRASDLVSLR